MRASILASTANTQHLEARLNAEIPLFSIATLGSSKTFTLIERIAFLPSENGLTPEKFMVVKITDKAAQELSTRTSNHLSAEAELQRLDSIEANQMWHQDRYEDVFNGH